MANRSKAVEVIDKAEDYVDRWLEGWQEHNELVAKTSKNALLSKEYDTKAFLDDAVEVATSFFNASVGWFFEGDPQKQAYREDPPPSKKGPKGSSYRKP